MKSSIERAMEKLESKVKIDAVQFSKYSKEDQELTISVLSEEDKWNNIRNLKLVDEDIYGLVVWKDVK